MEGTMNEQPEITETDIVDPNIYAEVYRELSRFHPRPERITYVRCGDIDDPEDNPRAWFAGRRG